MTSDLHIFDRLMEIAVFIQADLVRSFAGTGLTTSRTHLLWELHRMGPSTQQALAAALKVSPRNVTGLVDALEAAGFVQRGQHPTDRRATLVTLTELGGKTMADMVRDRELIASQLVADFGEDQLMEFGRSLDTVTGRLRDLVESTQSPTPVTA
jgi:DNA-binding MarR family transcriptional regulator